jgi:hypothetical protein
MKFKEQAEKQRKKIADLKRTQGGEDGGSPARSGPEEEQQYGNVHEPEVDNGVKGKLTEENLRKSEMASKKAATKPPSQK